MEENKIKNHATVEIELCDEKHVIESNTIEAEAVSIKLEKEQSCSQVMVGGKIKYTVKIINECGAEVHDLLFKDTCDECTKFVEGSFMVGEHHVTPEIHDHTLSYKIDKLESCDTITITFEVEATEACCKCHPCPDPDKSAKPSTRSSISRFERYVTGTGVRGATVYVTFPGDVVRSSTVSFLRAWSVRVPETLSAGDVITVVQVEPGKKPSDPVTITVF